MDRRRFLAASSGLIGLPMISSKSIAEESSSDSPKASSDRAGPQHESLPQPNGAAGQDPYPKDQSRDPDIYPQQTDEEVVLSGELDGAFSSDVGIVRIGPPEGEIITAEVLPDGSFAATVPAGQPLDVAYVQTDGESGLVTLNGNPDTYYIEDFPNGIQDDFDLGTVDIPDGHVVNVELVDGAGFPLNDVTVAIRSLGADSGRWWQIFYPTNADGFFQSPNSPTGIEVAGDIELAVFADTDDGRVPDVETTERFTVTGSRSETITVDPITVTGTIAFADDEPASNQNIWVFTGRNASANVTSDADGSFSVNLPPAPDDVIDSSYELQYYRQGLLNQETAVSIDGFVDMYAGPAVAGDIDKDVEEVTLPEGWLTQVRVEGPDGEDVEGAEVWYSTHNEAFDTSAGFTTSTNSNGNTPISGRTGLYLSGSVKIRVVPPESDEFAETVIERELDIDEQTTEVIELLPPIADYANDDGIVDLSGVSEVIDDWRAGDIELGLVSDVIDAWRSGDPVT